MRKQVLAKNAAPPKGAYSPALVASGTMLFVSGQGPVDPVSGDMKLGPFAEQAELAFANVTTLLEAAGTSWEKVVKVSVFLADLGDFGEMNEIYESLLTDPYPTRTTVQAVLPPGMLIEVDCIALVGENED